MPGFIGLFVHCDQVAEREGFEPPIGLHLCRISSAVHSTTLPPLLKAPRSDESLRGRGRVIGEDRQPDKARGTRFTKRSRGRNKGGTAVRDKNRRSRAVSLQCPSGKEEALPGALKRLCAS